MTINEASAAIEAVLAAMSVVQSYQVHPSGDDVDTIKVWVDLGNTQLDAHAWAKKLEVDLKQVVPGAAPYHIEVRAEAGV